MTSKDAEVSNASSGSAKVNPESKQNAGKVKFPWAVLFGLGMGMLVYGVAESYGPVTAISGVIPSGLSFLGYSLPYIAGGIGAGLSGLLADYYGRKTSFIITTILILIGIALYVVASSNVPLLIISFILVGMAAIGLESPILAMMSEAVPAKQRGSSLTIVQNFGNLGVAITFIPLLLGLSGAVSTTAIALLFIAPLAALIIIVLWARESIPWQSAAGKSEENVQEAWESIEEKGTENVVPTAGMGMRFLTLILIGIIQDVAFVYITYGVSYTYFFPIAPDVALVGGLTMVVVGIIAGIWVVHKVSRKSFATFSYVLLVILWALIWIYVDVTGDFASSRLLAFMAIPFIAVETTWASRAMLEPELFPTKRRATYISIVRLVVWVTTGIITGILTYYAPAFNVAMAVTMIIFLIGAAAAWVWQVKGFETGRKSLAGHDVKKQ
ncbi:MAG: MFS transporter [Nitrososphaerota archaeon]|jgi:MFS family permease|nr:MFS transporter [Nitrososphaerota archaeon]MDG6930126.1 MFS transporter [Nitrososphaerota archaeon]